VSNNSEVNSKLFSALSKPVADLLAEGLKHLSRQPMFVVDAFEAEVAGENGLVIWDYLVMNEVYFLPSKFNSRLQSFLTTMSDDKAKEKLEDLRNAHAVVKKIH
jgi:hypothetical protein